LLLAIIAREVKAIIERTKKRGGFLNGRRSGGQRGGVDDSVLWMKVRRGCFLGGWMTFWSDGWMGTMLDRWWWWWWSDLTHEQSPERLVKKKIMIDTFNPKTL
jgi:hypothetical protein